MRRKMKKSLFVCVMVLSYLIANAQNRIYGTVTGPDHQPVTGAIIFVPEQNKGTVADAEGKYELNNLPSSKLTLQFSFIGYTSRVETVFLHGDSLRLDIAMDISSNEMETVVVSGGHNSTQHATAVKIDVLKLDRQMSAATPTFAQSLTKIPGVDMISKGSGVSKPVIRGLSMNDILVLNNGVRFENYQYSSHHPLGIDEFGIENVEIIKGPASLLYGSDAIGGVVNFIKENPATIGSVAGDYNMQLFSNTSGIVNNVGVKASSKNIFGGIRVGQKSHTDYRQGGGAYVPNSRFNEMSAKANAGITGKTGTFKLYYDYTDEKLGMVEDEAIEAVTEHGRKNEIWYQALNTHLLSSQNKLYLGNYKLDVNAAYQNTALSHIADTGVYEIQMDLATLTYDAKLYLPSDRMSEYIVGAQGFNQSNKNINNRETKLLPDAVTNNYSVFALVQHTFADRLTVQTGARYDAKSITSQKIGAETDGMAYRPALDKTFGSFSGSLGATLHVTESLLLRANIASAYRTPNLAELTSNGQHELRYEVGDRQLVPENAYESDLSLHYHRGNVTFDVAGFYNMVNNYIFIAPTGSSTPDGTAIYQYLQANSALYGGETGVHIHPQALPWLHLEAAYSTVTGKQSNGDYLPFVPAQKIRCEIRGERERLLFLNKAFASTSTSTAFDQNNAAPDETPTAGYTLADAAIGGGIAVNKQVIIISLGINNILDTKYIDHLSTLKEVDLNNPGRNISLGIKIPFGIRTANKG